MEAYVLLGFCYYHDGRMDEAITAYQRASQLNPAFFWPYYNLGVIYFNQKNYTAAAPYFKQAAATDPRETLREIFTSHIYMEILNLGKEMREAIQKNLTASYKEAYESFLLSEYYRVKKMSLRPEQLQLQLKLF